MRLDNNGRGYIITGTYDDEVVIYYHTDTYADAVCNVDAFAGRNALAGWTVTAQSNDDGALVGATASNGAHEWARSIAAL
jgi:hypothetical protein